MSDFEVATLVVGIYLILVVLMLAYAIDKLTKRVERLEGNPQKHPYAKTARAYRWKGKVGGLPYATSSKR